LWRRKGNCFGDQQRTGLVIVDVVVKLVTIKKGKGRKEGRKEGRRASPPRDAKSLVAVGGWPWKTKLGLKYYGKQLSNRWSGSSSRTQTGLDANSYLGFRSAPVMSFEEAGGEIKSS
jgi:hypothetical protein